MSVGTELVSVIVPTHNRAKFLKQALLSILQQSYSRIEIIVVANGCNDNTEHVVSEIKSNVKRKPHPEHSPAIVFLNVEETLGGAKARNIGIDHASGEYIAFLDDDDIWHVDKLKTQIRVLQRYHCALVGANFFYLYGNKNRYLPAGRLKQGMIGWQDLTCENSLGGFSLCMTKKSYLGKSRINEELTALQDWDLWLKILQNSGLSARIDTARHVYMRVDGNRISNSVSTVIHAQKLFLQFWQHCLDEPSIHYHQMRTLCMQLKIAENKKLHRYILNLGGIVKTIFRSHEKANFKRYVHYLLMPLVDLDAARIILWKCGGQCHATD